MAKTTAAAEDETCFQFYTKVAPKPLSLFLIPVPRAWLQLCADVN